MNYSNSYTPFKHFTLSTSDIEGLSSESRNKILQCIFAPHEDSNLTRLDMEDFIIAAKILVARKMNPNFLPEGLVFSEI